MGGLSGYFEEAQRIFRTTRKHTEGGSRYQRLARMVRGEHRAGMRRGSSLHRARGEGRSFLNSPSRYTLQFASINRFHAPSHELDANVIPMRRPALLRATGCTVPPADTSDDTFVIDGNGRCLALLLEPDLADIDRHHQHLPDRMAIGSARICTTLGWETNAVRFHIVGSQLRRSKAARNIYTIVVAAQ
jgi:hypothetical protein